ncbi:putative transcriptional regulator [Hoeflea phototrophica DFL-43]|jgi:DNA-binding transcriptional ArsR family regulator|uniref:Putative transcriptional regulator n=1 Tax=Hoeflea phototrophica (strain DSM 17068 / NCIMB 14078 / DFL-43) TaxID=411684 RepID=A9DB82_HOEPD|nr:metalloregulator ArsR/SmtB family transcription factor [Hoeflea phototrophica]EDQ32462.1 putative transcriptional regulator [Hoeflea phototrophica DFL-43]
MNGQANSFDQRDEEVARKLAALGHPVRLRLLRQIGSMQSCCVKEMVSQVGMAQSTVSQHLKVLVEAGLISYRPERPRSCYRINAAALGELAGDIGETIDHCCSGNRANGLGCDSGRISCHADASMPQDVNKDI